MRIKSISKKHVVIFIIMTGIYFTAVYRMLNLFRVTDYFFLISVGFILTGSLDLVMDSGFLAPVSFGMGKFMDILMNRTGTDREKVPGGFADYLRGVRRNRSDKMTLLIGAGCMLVAAAASAMG